VSWTGHSEGTLGAPSPFGEREPIAVFAVDGIREGWIPTPEGRLSDGLNDADRMRFREAHDGREEWVEVELDSVVAVAAAPRPPSPLRVGRRQHAVEIEAGPYRVRGLAHMPLGADPERYVAMKPRQWLPLTTCTVAAGEDEWAVDVVIVNLNYAAERREQYLPPPFG
jgi:hypothetical protein